MASAAIGAGASLLSGITGGKGASAAAKTQAAAYQKGIDEQAREFGITQQNFAPYLAAGNKGLGSILDLLGLNGNDTQGSAIDALKASPAFTSLFNTGVDTINQNAAATGGLRGGNTQNSLANFGSGLLSTVIQNQLSNLSPLVATGAGSAGTLGGLGQQNANAISDLLGKQGNANAISAAAPWATLSGIFSNIGGNAKSGNGLLSGISGSAW